MLNKPIVIEIDKPLDLPIHSVQFDKNSRFIDVYLLNNSLPLDVTRYTVTVAGIKPDGQSFFNECSKVTPHEGLVRFEVTEQMNITTGIVKCELKIYNDSEGVLTTKPFDIKVTRSLLTSDVESTSEFQALTEAISKIQGFDNKLLSIKVDYNKKIAQTLAQLSEYIKSGYATLNDFDEETRSVILGLKEGEINVVLGDNNVVKDNLRHNIVDPDILATEYNMFNKNKVSKNQVIVGENADKTINIGVNNSNSIYSLKVPSKGALRISVFEPASGQFIVYMRDNKMVARSTYDEVLQEKTQGSLAAAPFEFNKDTSELILFYERLSSEVDTIYLSILNDHLNDFYIIGKHVFSAKELEWLEEANPNSIIKFINFSNTELSYDNLISKNKRLRGYDTTTYDPVFIDEFGYLNFSLDIEKYKNSILEIGGVADIANYTGQRFMYLDDRGKCLAHYTFAQTTDEYKLNVMKIRQQHPKISQILVSIPFDDRKNICEGYILNQKFNSSLDQSLSDLKDKFDNLWNTELITHNQRITAYNTTTGELKTEISDSYFYMIIDNPRKGEIEVPIAQNTTCQLVILIDENGAFRNTYSTNILENGSTGYIEYEVGSDSFTIKCEQLPAQTTKIAISFRYDYPSFYLKGTGTMELANIPGLDLSELNKPAHEIIMPNKFICLEGVESNIYFNNVVRYVDTDTLNNATFSNADEFSKRYARFNKPSGNFTSTLTLYNADFVAYKTKLINGICIPKSAGAGLTKKCLFIGDSLTDATTYAQELVNLFNNDAMNVELLGTRGSGDAKHEGRSGWRAWEYVNLEQGEFGYLGANEFYNPNSKKFDFSYYMNKQNYFNVDYVFINLGTNDIGRNHHNTDEDIVESYDYMIKSIKDFNHDVKIVLWLPPTRALGMVNTSKANINTSLRANKLLIETYDNRESENIYLMPVYFNIDPFYDYNYEEVNVSSRNSKFKEMKCSDITHPSVVGYYKIADVIYAFIKYLVIL